MLPDIRDAYSPNQIRSKRLKLRSRNGCLTCKLRRRKCDENRPKCGYCLNGQHACRWPGEDKSAELHQQLVERLNSQRHRYSLEIKSEDVSFALSQDHGTVRTAYMLQNLFRGANVPYSGGETDSLTVHTELHFATDDASLTSSCLEAMATVFWATAHRDKDLLHKGLQARSVVLQRLGGAISQKRETFSGDLIAAVALARSFEHMLPDSHMRWIPHAQGMARIFDAMGPHAFRTPPMLRLLTNNRWGMIMSSSILRQESLLDTVEWKTVPWQDVLRKDILQRLLDIYARVPGIHALFDTYSGTDSSREDRYIAELKLVQRLRQAIVELHEWRVSADQELTHSTARWDPPQGAYLCPWTTALSFEQNHHAYALGLYNMTVLVLCRYWAIFNVMGSRSEGPELPLTPGTLRKNLLSSSGLSTIAIQAADEIAMIIPWTLQAQYKGAGALYMSGPATVSCVFWQRFSPLKAKWFEDTIKYMSSSWNSIVDNSQYKS